MTPTKNMHAESLNLEHISKFQLGLPDPKPYNPNPYLDPK